MDEPPFVLSEESDRGCVLVGAALLDNQLELLLRSAFAKDVDRKLQEALFDANGPLATFAGKLKIAFAFGLITAGVYRDIDEVRKIRNDVAHTIGAFDFHDPGVKARVESLSCVKQGTRLLSGLSRFSPAEANPLDSPTTAEARARASGYVKAVKVAFEFGIRDLHHKLTLATIRAGALRRLPAAE